MSHASELSDQITGYRTTSLIQAAAEMNLADRLSTGAKTASEIAADTGLDVGRLEQVLGALVSIDILQITSVDHYRLTPKGEFLGSDHPESLKNSALYFGSVSAPAYTELYRSLHGGISAFEIRYGRPFYKFLADNPHLAAAYDDIIAINGLGSALALAYDFSSVSTVADLGGGRGLLMQELLSAVPNIRGILFDIPEVFQSMPVPAVFDDLIAERCEVIAGNFLESVPQGADVYILARVLPNWEDSRVGQILTNIKKAALPSSELIIVDFLMTQPSAGFFAPLGDVNALVHFGGKLRDEAAINDLLRASAFSQIRNDLIKLTPSYTLSMVTSRVGS